jgi:hypothetical protein
MRKSNICLLATLCLGGAISFNPVWAVPVTMPTSTGTIIIDSNNFATTVVGSSLSSTSAIFGPGSAFTSGPFTTAQAIPYVVGSDLTQGLSLGAGPTGGIPDFIVPAFAFVSILNDTGADFAVWEAGAPSEPFLMAVSTDGGASFSANVEIPTIVTSPLVTTPPFNVNIALVDLGLFGIASGAHVDAIKLSGIFTGVGGSGPDLLALAAINAGPPTGNVPGGNVPEPGILALLISGLGGVGFSRLRKSRLIR